MSQNTNHENHEVEGGHHIVPFTTLRNVLFGLLVLTALTVATARMHLGMMAAPIAFLIATLKAMMVVSYFMGLKYDSKLNRLIFGSGFFFLALLYAFSVMDIFTRVKVISHL